MRLDLTSTHAVSKYETLSCMGAVHMYVPNPALICNIVTVIGQPGLLS